MPLSILLNIGIDTKLLLIAKEILINLKMYFQKVFQKILIGKIIV